MQEALRDAKRLFARWKRFGYDDKMLTLKKFPARVNKKQDFLKPYKQYVAWLDTHHPLPAVPGAKNSFDEAKLEKAIGDATYANVLFGRWKRRGFELDDVFYKLKAMGMKDDDEFYKRYADYKVWLDIHHPLKKTKKTKKTTAIELLFNAGRLDRAMADSNFAERLFRKWKRSGYASNQVFRKFERMGFKTNKNNIYSLYEKYFWWLEEHFPMKTKT
ncbi:unnamed protein product [Phytophthora lilii]|uniref:Unnamed protein product n=1 Tax=Phytophthora lilii TaxID=2077276 RepID=A0A9W6WW08_9STRA|nr:unnamed protein product [Phytophthora lilii]